jgi:hypothetical protein
MRRTTIEEGLDRCAGVADGARAGTDQFDAIKARAAAAAPGPWCWRGNVDCGDVWLGTYRPGLGLCHVMGHVPVERTENDRSFREYLEDLLDEQSRQAARDAYLRDAYGEPIRDDWLSFGVDGISVEARKLAVFEVAPTATDRDDPRVYRADVVGVRHPDAEFIAAARSDVDWLIGEVERLRGLVPTVEAVREWGACDTADDPNDPNSGGGVDPADDEGDAHRLAASWSSGRMCWRDVTYGPWRTDDV